MTISVPAKTPEARRKRRNSLRVLSLILCVFAGTVSCKPRLFTELSSDQTGITFVNDVHDTDSLNILTYPYFYNGGGVAVGDLNNDGLTDVFLTANRRGGNRLYFNRGNRDGRPLTFEDVTAKAGVAGRSDWNTGVTLVDINADGWLDLYVCGVDLAGRLHSRNELYINRHDGTFREEAARYGLAFRGHSTQAVFFDYDHDTDLDCFLLNHAVSLRDDYREASARNQPDSVSGDKLFENRNGRFVDVTAQAGLYGGSAYGLGVAVGDLNNDGWEDLYVANDFRENDYCYLNNGSNALTKQRFSEQGRTLFAHHSRNSMGCDIADLTGDGNPDVVTLDMLPADERVLNASVGDDEADVYDYKQGFGFHNQYTRNTLQVNQGAGVPFSDQALLRGVAATDWSWCPLAADFTNDGLADLLITNGIQRRTNDLDFARFVHQPNVAQQLAERRNLLDLIRQMPDGRVPDYFFENGGNGFTDRSADAGFDRPTLSNGAAYADLDNDGDLDVVMNRVNEPAGVYRNDAPRRNYLQLDLHGPKQNRFGIGATVDVYAGGRHQRVGQMLTRGFLSAVSPVLHVGLDTATVADSVVVRWNERDRQVLRRVRANQRLKVRYVPGGLPGRGQPVAEPGWLDRTEPCGIHWKHAENAFNDFAVSPLIPHKVSTQGPKVAVGDVNADGLDDFYAGGAGGQPGALFVQRPDGTFGQTNQAVFAPDAACEDVDALFFDADGDRDLDLYIVSGGNQAYGTDSTLRDRLYRNDGAGQFRKDATFPALYENKSCVRAADFDRDGDPDLFVGGRVNARLYGATPTSVLLRNDRGHFSIRTDRYAPGLETVGMVTDARWCDLNRDGWPDLIVVGEWMPVSVFLNRRGHLERLDVPELAHSHGLWTCLMPIGDGDFLIGNWGLNSKLTATQDAPLRLYIADPDHNGEADPLLTRVHNGREYPFLGKDRLEARWPYLKKKHLYYRDAAGQSLNELFGESLRGSDGKPARQLNAFTLASSRLRYRNGTFSLTPLPTPLQTAPITCFATLSSSKQSASTVLIAGNFYGTTPYEGRYDALPAGLWKLTDAPAAHLLAWLPLAGAFTDAKLLRLAAGGRAVVLTRNNDSLRIFGLNGRSVGP